MVHLQVTAPKLRQLPAPFPKKIFPNFFSSSCGSLSTPRTVPWQQRKPSRACGLCLMRPTLTLCGLCPSESQCPSSWRTPLGLLAPSPPWSSVGEREYRGMSGSSWGLLPSCSTDVILRAVGIWLDGSQGSLRKCSRCQWVFPRTSAVSVLWALWCLMLRF